MAPAVTTVERSITQSMILAVFLVSCGGKVESMDSSPGRPSNGTFDASPMSLDAATHCDVSQLPSCLQKMQQACPFNGEDCSVGTQNGNTFECYASGVTRRYEKLPTFFSESVWKDTHANECWSTFQVPPNSIESGPLTGGYGWLGFYDATSRSIQCFGSQDKMSVDDACVELFFPTISRCNGNGPAICP
jgi:hypothetical protein